MLRWQRGSGIAHTVSAISLVVALALAAAWSAGWARAYTGDSPKTEPPVARDATPPPAQASSPAGDLFQNRVQPILKAKCLGCHGEAETIEDDLDLRTRAGILEGGSNGPAIVPGMPDESLLFQAVLRKGEHLMPPKAKDRLSADDVAAIRTWIAAGAPWATRPVAQATKWSYTEEDTWAFRPVKHVQVPAVAKAADEARNPIDAFVLEKLRAKQLEPAPAADRRTLIRRVTFDLIGLPPTPGEVDAFLNDPAPDDAAFDKVVERLLASPHYGEQWARHWLDVVRYADTDGYANDYERPNAWRYRDYVIRSFNEDKPYDRFIREQVAGDELAPESAECQVAVGFLRMGPWEQTGMSVAAVTRQLFLDDVTHSTVNTFLGLTMGCARCHDHKFDPLPTRDYYRLQAIFAPVQFEERATLFLAGEEHDDFAAQRARIDAQIERDEARLAVIKQKVKDARQALLAKHGVKSVDELPADIQPKDNRYGLTDADQERERVYNKRLELLRRASKRYQPLAFSVSSGGLAKPVPTPELAILIGGSLAAPGETVSPGVLSAFAAVAKAGSKNADDPAMAGASVEIPNTDKGRRLALARWIASPENPLTARVMVNRIWQYHFGKGLVETSNNFGKMGKRPTHPELLDWLAERFVAEGWSVKAMQRLILRSDTYKRSGMHSEPATLREADPENALLAVFPPHRLTAEELRDGVLAVAGELSSTSGGPPVFPELNRDVARQPRQIMGTIAPVYQSSPRREERHRRSIYTVQMRNLGNPTQEVFNAADMNVSCERREATTVVPQVFALFHGELAHDLALVMAKRLENERKDLPAQIDLAFRLALGRPPSESERRQALAHVAAVTGHHQRIQPVREPAETTILRDHVGELSGKPFQFEEEIGQADYEPNLKPADVSAATRALAELCLVLINSNEFIYVD